MSLGLELPTRISGLEAVDTSGGLLISGKIELEIPEELIESGYDTLRILTVILQERYVKSSGDTVIKLSELVAVKPAERSTSEQQTDNT